MSTHFVHRQVSSVSCSSTQRRVVVEPQCEPRHCRAHMLSQRSANFVCRGPDSEYFQLCGPYILHGNNSSRLL